jgi:DNA-binding MarR family transcriptional regulator
MADLPQNARTVPKQGFLTDLLMVAAHMTGLAVSRIYANKLRSSEWRILVTLGQNGAMTATTIGQRSGIHKTKVSRAVARLTQQKLISRSVNKDDLRESFLSLTPAGRAIYNELAPVALNFENQILRALEPDDRAALERALHRITEQSKQIIEGQNSPDIQWTALTSPAAGRNSAR